MMKYFFIIVCLLVQFKATAQKNRQEFGLAAYNIGFAGISAGFGSMINKKKGTKSGKAFLRGFKYGCLGGAIDYGAKRIDYLVYHPNISTTSSKNSDKYLIWGWPTKIVNSIGTSIFYNAAQNKKNIFKNYNLPIGFINLNVNFEDKLNIKPQLMPYTAGTFVYFLTNKYFKFNPKQSVLSGTPIFTYNSDIPLLNYQNFGGRTIGGVVAMNNYSYNPSSYATYRLLLAHELIHTLQVKEYQVFNSYFIKSYNKILANKSKLKSFLSKYIYCDISYQGVFYSIMKPSQSVLNSSANAYYKNIFELEAEHFATNSYISHN